MRQLSRLWLVVLLMAGAIGAPSLAWWVSASREADRESMRMKAEARQACEARAAELARRIADRLEQLRGAENARPYYQYQNLYHDPRGASQGLSVVPSPLAAGPGDPLILAHFQVTGDGRVSLPTLNEEVAQLSAPDGTRQRSIRETLAAAAPAMLQSEQPRLDALHAAIAKETGNEVNASPSPRVVVNLAGEKSTERASEAATKPGVQTKPTEPAPAFATSTSPLMANAQTITPLSNWANASSSNAASSLNQAAQSPLSQLNASLPEVVQTQTLDSSAFTQNVRANDVYRQIQEGPPRAIRLETVPSSSRPSTPTVSVHTGDFEWQTIAYAGKPAIAALRPVVTPAGGAIQGFVLGADAMRALTASDALVTASTIFPPGTNASAPVASTGWKVVVDERPLLAEATAEGTARKEEFRRRFAIGMCGALLALVAVAVMMRQSERLARERARFAAAAAHELRTPIASLQLYGGMLADELGDPARSGDYARQIEEQAARLGRVVTNMLEYSRLERGTMAAEPRPGDLGAAVADCVTQLRPAVESAGCVLTLAVDDALPEIAFDRDALYQIVQNLVDNAEKYSRGSAERLIDVTVARDAGGVALTVADRGPGLPADVVRGRFAPFRRGAVTDQPAGLGLGLSLAQALARAQGAMLTATARQPLGTIFTLRFPLA